MLRYWLGWPFRQIESAFYWAQFRVGGSTRAQLESLRKDNTVLWDELFKLRTDLVNLRVELEIKGRIDA